MTPHRTGGKRGAFKFDRVFRGVGRISRTSGATSEREFRQLDSMLDRLFAAGQLEVLRLIQRGPKKGGVTARTVRDLERRGRLHADALVAEVHLAAPLFDTEGHDGAVSSWLATAGGAQGGGLAHATKERYALAFRELRDALGDAWPIAPTVYDLGAVPWVIVWGALAEHAAATRNRIRTAVSAFLSHVLADKSHPFRRAVVVAMGKLEREAPRVVDLTEREFWRLMNAVGNADVVASLVTVAASGLRVGEFLQATGARLVERQNREGDPVTLCEVTFPGGKTGAGYVYLHGDLWPYVEAAVPCRIAPRPAVWRGVQFDARYKALRRALLAASADTGIPATIHSLRHLFIQSGIESRPESEVQAAARHRSPLMTREYSARSVRGDVAHAVGLRLLHRRGA